MELTASTNFLYSRLQKISVEKVGNSLGSFHVLNYSCPRQPEVNVLWGRNKVKIVNHIKPWKLKR